jgi:hypothetical protein
LDIPEDDPEEGRRSAGLTGWPDWPPARLTAGQ